MLLFEWKRALTLPRMAWWAILAAFPVFIVGLVRFIAMQTPPRELWAGLLFALVPMLVTMLGTLLWATPAISTELERRSWIYLAVRPHGSTAVLLGKYLAAVTWVIPPALLGLSIAVPLAAPKDAWLLWWAMVRLVCLSCPAYAAIYLLLGTLLPRRAMVLAVAYTLLFELVISFIPAVINKVTVQYRLRALWEDWCDIPALGRQATVMALMGDAPPWQHVTILLLLVPALLAVSVAVLRMSEFSSSAESDV
ncbi:MAG: hypothetical protein HY290_07975 [Planctomycetia bacterium]|nr:hypothetical protein [Planctomycetia bacterium]